MDFFTAQDIARRNSRLLVLWFALAVAGIIAAVYAAVTLAMILGMGSAAAMVSLWDPGLFLLTALAVGTVILAGSLYKSAVLARGGGAAVAASLGGRLVPRAAEAPLERRLINVVDEMAIASGIPAPPVYLLEDEAGINAFAAGTRPTEAVVAVTRGALEQLSRDELQGVVAHEFSHILNGDMRLNLRLIGVLHGILLLTLAGRVLMRSTRRRHKGAGPVVAMGVSLVAIGSIGVLFGKLIKAAVSRQREYLADAAAVQFTRNPGGIAGALRRIASIGSQIGHPRAEEASHLFFGTSARLSRLLATHPPIETRIRRIDPRYVPEAAVRMAAAPLGAAFTPSAFAASVGDPQPAHVAHARSLLQSLPADLLDAVHRPASAQAVVFGLLLAPDAAVRARQLAMVETAFGPEVRHEAARHADWLDRSEPEVRLPLLDLAIPTLRELDAGVRARLADMVDALTGADGRTSSFQYALRRLLHHGLAPRRKRPTGVGTLSELKSDTAMLLALLARSGADSAEEARAAFAAATVYAPQDGPWEMPTEAGGFAPEEMDRAIDHLATTSAGFRRKLVEACAAAVLHDGRVAPAEGELLRAVCEALDCPVPPLAAAPMPGKAG